MILPESNERNKWKSRQKWAEVGAREPSVNGHRTDQNDWSDIGRGGCNGIVLWLGVNFYSMLPDVQTHVQH